MGWSVTSISDGGGEFLHLASTDNYQCKMGVVLLSLIVVMIFSGFVSSIYIIVLGIYSIKVFLFFALEVVF